MSTGKQARKEHIERRFGSRNVFIVHMIGLTLTMTTVILTILLWFVSDSHGTEKMIEHIALCSLAVLLLNIPVFMRERLHFRIPAFLHIVVTIFIVAHCVLGEIYQFYYRIPFYDKVLHTTAGIVIGALGFSVVYGFSKTASGSVRLSPLFVALFSFCFALALLVIWELFEFSMDSMFGLNMQRWQNGLTEKGLLEGGTGWVTNPKQGSGLIDTMEDMIVGTVGAFIVCLIGGVSVKKYPDSTRFYVTKDEKPAAAKAVQPESADGADGTPDMIALSSDAESDSGG